jgi:hypothetical protein
VLLKQPQKGWAAHTSEGEKQSAVKTAAGLIAQEFELCAMFFEIG